MTTVYAMHQCGHWTFTKDLADASAVLLMLHSLTDGNAVAEVQLPFCGSCDPDGSHGHHLTVVVTYGDEGSAVAWHVVPMLPL